MRVSAVPVVEQNLVFWWFKFRHSYAPERKEYSNGVCRRQCFLLFNLSIVAL